MAKDREHYAHLQWLGYVQPVGLVVSIPALLDAQAQVNANIGPLQQRLLASLARNDRDEVIPQIADFPQFVATVLGWRHDDLLGGPGAAALPESLEVVLETYHETLRPTYAVKKLSVVRSPLSEHEKHDSSSDIQQLTTDNSPLLLIQVLPAGTELDKAAVEDDRRWQASPQARLERLLRETEVPIGLLVNGTHVRLVYAPRGETSGHVMFAVKDMAEIAGRPILAAFEMLLSAERVFNIGLGKRQDLASILADSRKRQNVVSTQLAEQVLAALNELLRGFQAANDQRHGQLLAECLADDPNQVYGGLLTVLLRLVFLLYAEDRDLLSGNPIFVNHYSAAGLFERLRADDGRYRDTMDQRYGAWAQLLALFRLIYDGGSHGSLNIPGRQGYLFDPDRYPFLEGRAKDSLRAPGQQLDLPRVSDGVVYRVLSNLLILDGERLSYRTLDVQEIGSVYETVMGFNLEVAAGRSIAIKAVKSGGAPAIVNLEALVEQKPAERARRLADESGQKFTGQAAEAIKQAGTVEELRDALDKKIAWRVTPSLVPKGAMVLQPSDERRRSGSHYTPRSLTGPIVRTTLRPILERLSSSAVSSSPLPAEGEGQGVRGPTPQQILDLKVCDPAMGSGAFLVEACRQLGDELVKAWHVHNCVPKLPPDEDELLHARRLVAQRCLYGVDRNPMAVDLAKLSLWLATLAKDHPFTFLDHSLRHGDSLVGLTRQQIIGFDLAPSKQIGFVEVKVRDRLKAATNARRAILEAGDDMLPGIKQHKLQIADEALDLVRLAGDTVVASFFAGAKPKERKSRRDEYFDLLDGWLQRGDGEARHKLEQVVSDMRAGATGPHSITPFHWEIEFPEVFGRENGGFDAIVGNPPFLGGTLIGGRLGLSYHDYLIEIYPPATGLADVIAFFLRQSFASLRREGAFGLIATNTVAQGDTRSAGLEAIVREGGRIYQAHRRYEWPGEAAVVVSVVHIARTQESAPRMLDNISVDRISSFLLKGDTDTMPVALSDNKGLGYLGTKIWGAGFVFEDEPSGGSSSISEMERLISLDSRNREVIFAYMGGEEFNSSPTQSSRRFVIDFGNMSESEAQRWPLLFSIVEERVRPVRAGNKQRNYRDNWWLHTNRVDEAGPHLRRYGRLLALTSVSRFLSAAFAKPDTILANSMVLLLLHEDADFAVIQSRLHETWARFVGSSMKDDLRYTTPCFDTFARPHETDLTELNAIGKKYHAFRASLMVKNNEGLTKIYNRFHDPHETSADIQQLRELHTAMDRAVLDSYHWTDLQPTCEFLLDYDDEVEDEEAAGGQGRGRQKKRPWRFRWPDDFRDEVLARLLALNAERAEQERLSGLAAEQRCIGADAAAVDKTAKGKQPRKKTAKPRKAKVGELDLFSAQLDRNHRYVLMLLRAWDGRLLTRRALNAGMILMLDDQLRTALLHGTHTVNARKREDAHLNHIYTELSIDGFIHVHSSGVQQVVQITKTAPSADDATPEDVERINAVKEYFRREQATDRVTVSEEFVDADFDFVPA